MSHWVKIAYQAHRGQFATEPARLALFGVLAQQIEHLERQLPEAARRMVTVYNFTLPGRRCIWCKAVPVERGHGRQCADRGEERVLLTEVVD